MACNRLKSELATALVLLAKQTFLDLDLDFPVWRILGCSFVVWPGFIGRLVWPVMAGGPVTVTVWLEGPGLSDMGLISMGIVIIST